MIKKMKPEKGYLVGRNDDDDHDHVEENCSK